MNKELTLGKDENGSAIAAETKYYHSKKVENVRPSDKSEIKSIRNKIKRLICLYIR
jgi:hypothetical protein